MGRRVDADAGVVMAKFIVEYTFHGRTTTTIEADSPDEANAKIEAEVDAPNFEIDADEIDDVDFTVSEMHPVTRDGKEIWSTRVMPSDVRGHQSALASSPLFADRV